MDKTKILIVDDHRVVIKGVKSALADYPEFEVVGEAFNGRQAVKLAESIVDLTKIAIRKNLIKL